MTLEAPPMYARADAEWDESTQLMRAIELTREGDMTAVRALLVEVCRRNKDSELGWLWLASAAKSPAEGVECIKQVLRINCGNRAAKDWLRKYHERYSVRPAATPIDSAVSASPRGTDESERTNNGAARRPIASIAQVVARLREADQRIQTASEPTARLASPEPRKAPKLLRVARSAAPTPAATGDDSMAGSAFPAAKPGDPAKLKALSVPREIPADRSSALVAAEAPIQNADAPTNEPTTQAVAPVTPLPNLGLARTTGPAATAHSAGNETPAVRNLPISGEAKPVVAEQNHARLVTRPITEPKPTESALATRKSSLLERLAAAETLNTAERTPNPASEEENSFAAGECPMCAASIGRNERCGTCGVLVWPQNPLDFATNRSTDRERLAKTISLLEIGATNFRSQMRLALAHCNRLEFVQARMRLQNAAVAASHRAWPVAQRTIDFLKRPAVLVADDSATIRDVLVRLLDGGGYLPIPVGDAWEVKALAQTQSPSAILLDVTMPIMDGYEVCRQLRADKVTKGIPVIMVSGHGGLIDKVSGKLAGASDYVSKPFKPDQLLSLIRKYTAKPR